MTTKTVKSFKASIRCTELTLSVTVTDSKGKPHTLNLDRGCVDEAGVTSAEQGLIYAIENGGEQDTDYTMDLTADELAMLAVIKAKCQSKVAEEMGIELKEPEAPATPPCPKCGKVMFRMKSDKGWRCSASGKAVYRNQKFIKFSGCQGVRWDGQEVEAPEAPKTPVKETKPMTIAKGAIDMVKKTGNKIGCRIANSTFGTGDTSEERAITRKSNALEALTKKTYIVAYDISEEKKAAIKKMDLPPGTKRALLGPSPWLWCLGFRLQYSVWVLTEDGINSEVFAWLKGLWNDHGIKVDIIPQPEELFLHWRAICQRELDEEIRKAHGSLIERIGNADGRLKKALDEAETEAEQNDAGKSRDTTMRVIFREVAESLNASIKSAQQFDVTEQVQDLLDALRSAWNAQVKLFNHEAAAKGIKQVDLI